MNLGIPYGTSKINFIPMSEVKHSQGLHPSQANLGSQVRKGFRQLMKILMVHKHGSLFPNGNPKLAFILRGQEEMEEREGSL